MNPVFQARRAGVLLHPVSLPGALGNGDFGPDAYRFIDFLAASGFTLWQTLPLGPTHGDGSPYQCLSAHAGNPLLISPQLLAERGWLPAQDPTRSRPDPAAYRRKCLSSACRQFRRHGSAQDQDAYAHFTATQAWWLDDFALYQALREAHGQACWLDWPPPLRDRQRDALARARAMLASEIDQARFEQFVFFDQWQALRHYANQRGVLLFGDMPIFVAHDSADVWAQREHFALDAEGRPIVVAGVPPDYFSATGQRWGNPHYLWDAMQANGFRWWLDRLRTQLVFFDLIRIDHFRGFEAYWEIPAGAPTAIEGRWVKSPGRALFQAIQDVFGALPLVAEDLGIITPEVDQLRREFGLPGMKILQFAFEGGATNPYLPHNHELDSVVYTGTHDNNTTVGWFNELSGTTRQHVTEYLGAPQAPMPWPLVRAALASVARLAVIPMQDLLALDGAHRMNTPGTSSGNWRWRFDWEQVPADLAPRLRRMNEIYGRI